MNNWKQIKPTFVNNKISSYTKVNALFITNLRKYYVINNNYYNFALQVYKYQLTYNN